MALPRLLDHGRAGGLCAVAALTLAQGAAAGAAAFATRSLFDAMHGGDPLPFASLGILVGAGAIIAATRIAGRYLGERLGQDYASQIRAALFDHAARMPARAVAERRAGYMSLRFVGDMTAFRNWLGLGLPRLIAGALLMPATIVVLWLLDPAFAGAVTPVFLVTLVLIALGGLRLVPLQRRLRMRRARIAAEMAERMPLAPQLDRLGRRGKELAQLDKRTGAMIAVALRHRLAAESLKALPDFAAGVSAALVIIVGHRAGLGTGSIAAALAAVGLLLSPLRDLAGVWNHWAAFRTAASKADAALSRARRDLYRSDTALPKGPVEVVFEDVALPSGTRLACHIDPGTTTDFGLADRDAEAVTDMLLGLDAPRSGRILLTGKDLRDLSRGSLRRGVHRIGAQPAILQGSLRRVLLLGLGRSVPDRRLETVGRDMGLGPLLDRIGGLDGTVAEAGRCLSPGERIAISLVRARLQRPRLILLDPDLSPKPDAWLETALNTRGATVIRLGRGCADAAATPGAVSCQTRPR